MKKRQHNIATLPGLDSSAPILNHYLNNILNKGVDIEMTSVQVDTVNCLHKYKWKATTWLGFLNNFTLQRFIFLLN